MPAPSNDNFASAIALSTTLPGSRVNDTTRDATGEGSEPIPYGDTIQSVWYTFTPTSTGRYRFKLTNMTADGPAAGQQRITVAIYSGSTLAGLTELASAINGLQGETTSIVSATAILTSGTTYRIQVASPLFTAESSNAHTCEYDLGWEVAGTGSAPANDNIASAINLGTDPTSDIFATTKMATAEAWEQSGGYFDPSVWYRFHSSYTGTQYITLARVATSGWFPYYEVYRITTDPPADYTDITFIDSGDTKIPNQNYFDSLTNTAIPVIAGADYLIYVGTWYVNREWDDFELFFGAPASAPGNNNRSAVTVYSQWALAKSNWGNYYSYPEAQEMAGTTTLATAEGGDPTIAGFAATRNVWYRASFNYNRSTKVWVESAVDCVLGIYEIGASDSIGTLVAADDDSGPGNQPEITFTPDFSKDYWFVVDSKTAGDFTIKYRHMPVSAPANDDFANATVISSLPSVIAGTTVGATAETAEVDAEGLGAGPKDSVWYKYVAPANGQLSIKATVSTNNDDAEVYVDVWKGTTLAGLVREPPDLVGVKGFFGFFDTQTQINNKRLTVNIVSGQTYYIRVQTFSGGSEGFTLYTEVDSVYVDIQPSSVDVGPYADANTAYVNIQALGADEFHGVILDSATVYVDIQSSGIDLPAKEYVDVVTVYYNISIDSHDCHTIWEPTQLTAYGRRRYETSTNGRWNGTRGFRRYEAIGGDGLEEC